MDTERFKRNGPRVFGYEPGWLWWAVLLIALGTCVFVIQYELDKRQRTRAYIDRRIVEYAKQQGLDLALVHAVVEAESGYDWRAESDAGARGLMQVTPIALEDVRQNHGIGSGDLYNVDYNLQVGTLYLKQILDRFEGDVSLAVAAYHMGPTAVSKGIAKYPELKPREMIDKHGGPQTRAYVAKVMKLYEEK